VRFERGQVSEFGSSKLLAVLAVLGLEMSFKRLEPQAPSMNCGANGGCSKLNVQVLGRHVGTLEQVGEFKSVMAYVPDVAPENLVSLTMPMRTESFPMGRKICGASRENSIAMAEARMGRTTT
jgi:hypothetical protein